jgi:hypothetical protein
MTEGDSEPVLTGDTIRRLTQPHVGAGPVKKGRHRRFEEARALKRSTDLDLANIFDSASAEPCPECGSEPGTEHASWCLFEEEEDQEAGL